jgi:hypothetical protein
MYISLDNDMWDDAGKKYFVLEWSRKKSSTAIRLVLEDEDGNIITRTESATQIVVEEMK